jgi:predicted nucleic acid-binding protein
MALILDAGALIALERRDRRVIGRLALAHREAEPVVTPSAAVAQVLRDPGRQVVLERALRGIEERALDHEAARAIGRLLARVGTNDVVDAAVAVAAGPGDVVLTSDPVDLAALTRGRPVRIIAV